MNHVLLKDEIKKKGIKLKVLAEVLDITPVALYKKLNGVTKFYVVEATTILDVLDIPRSELDKFFINKVE